MKKVKLTSKRCMSEGAVLTTMDGRAWATKAGVGKELRRTFVSISAMMPTATSTLILNSCLMLPKTTTMVLMARCIPASMTTMR